MEAKTKTPYQMGKEAFERGIFAPAQDQEFLTAHLRDGMANKEAHKHNIKVMKEWIAGWTSARLSAPLPE